MMTITVAEAAEIIGCTPRHIQRLAKQGTLTAIRNHHHTPGRPHLLLSLEQVAEYEYTRRHANDP